MITIGCMSLKIKLGVIALGLVIASAAIGATAYTTGSVDRQSNVNVVSDDQGLIALEDGTSGNLVQQNASGALTIDFTRNGASGVNTASHYELGDPNNGNVSTAFNITNLDGVSHDLTVSYTGATDGGDGDANIQFQIYDGSNTKVATVSEETTSATISGVGSGTTHYVVMVVDTHGVSDTSDLSGTLTVSA